MTVTSSGARPDLAAHGDAVRLTPEVLVKELRALLGARLVAYLGGVQETRAVRQWADGTRAISSRDVEQRLRVAYQVARLITVRDSTGVAQAWFQGMNPHLQDQAPATVLRDGDVAADGPRVLAAARAFAATG